MTQDSWSTRVTGEIIAEVKRLREKRRWSAQQLSEECKRLGFSLSRSTIADLENGRRMHFGIPELLVLARALDVPPLMLLFRVGAEEQTELLPGEYRAPFRAAEWFSDQGPYPAADQAGIVTTPEEYGWASARALALYRKADACFADEMRFMRRARQYDVQALEAANDRDREAALRWAADYRKSAENARAEREDVRKQAESEGLVPPPAVMSLTPEGEHLIV